MTRRTVFGVIGGSAMALVAAGAMLIGVRAHAQGLGGPHAGIMKRMVSAALDEALAQAAVSAEQRAAIYASRDRAFAVMDAQRPDLRAHREQVLTLFESDRLDLSQLQALHTQMEQRRQAVRDAVAQAVVEVHDTLTPDQRRIVAAYARTLGPGRMP